MFGPFLTSQKFLGPFTSTIQFTIALHYYDSYVKNKDNTRPLTTYKYRQFFAIPKKQAKTEKKRKLRCHIF